MLARLKTAARNLAIAYAVVMAALFLVNEHAFYQMAIYTLYVAAFPAMGCGLYLMGKMAFK